MEINKLNALTKKKSGFLLFVFFFLPILVGKLSLLLKIHDLQFIDGWKNFYKAAWGDAGGYYFTVLSSLILSPLVVIWVRANSDVKEIDNKSKAFALGVCGLFIASILSVVLVLALPVSSIENPTKGVRLIILLGKSHFLFGLGYGIMVAACVVMAYGSVAILRQVIKK